MELRVFSFLIFLSGWQIIVEATRTITVTYATGSCAVTPVPSLLTTIYTMTDSAGAVLVTTATLESSPQESIILPLTSKFAESMSSQPIAISTGTGPVTTSTPAPRNSTNSPASTLISPSNGGSSAAAPSPSAPCPQAAFAQIYNSQAGATWQIFCSADVYYYDLPSVKTDSFEECIDACDTYQPSGSFNYPCVAVTWTQATSGPAANCLLKYGVSQVIYGSANYCSAKLASYVLPPDFPVSIVSSYASLATAASPTKTLSFATGTAVSHYESASPCPLTNNSMYVVPDGSGTRYEILCGVSLQYNDLPDINVGSLEDCIAACEDWVPTPDGDPYDEPCIAVTYIGYNPQLPSCFRHYALNNNSVVDNHPYGDSAIRQSGHSLRLRNRQIGSKVRSRVPTVPSVPADVVRARTVLARQGIDLVIHS